MKVKVPLSEFQGEWLETAKACAQQDDPSLAIASFNVYSPCFRAIRDYLMSKGQAKLPPKETKPSKAAESKGLGDTIEKLIKAAQLDKLADLYEKLSGEPCRCPARKAWLNKLLPYRRNADEKTGA
jgi:hypothetical protein